MMKIIGILLIVALILRIEMPALLQKKSNKEVVIFLFFLLIGTSLGIVLALGKPIPTPADLLTFILKPINETFFVR